MTELDHAVQHAAERIRLAGSLRRPCPPIRDLIGLDDVESAYAVQRHVTELQQISGARPVGRKIGLTGRAVQRQLGVAQPTSGVLLDTMRIVSDSAVPVSRLLQPLIEAEILIVLGQDLIEPELSAESIAEAVAGVTVALEVVDSRIANWDISVVDTIADNASSGLFVPSTQLSLPDLDTLKDLPMTMTCNGAVVSSGVARDSYFGDPLVALQWLARAAQLQRDPLRAGELIMTGAMGPMVSVNEGDTYRATVAGLGSVAVDFRSSAELVAGERGV